MPFGQCHSVRNSGFSTLQSWHEKTILIDIKSGVQKACGRRIILRLLEGQGKGCADRKRARLLRQNPTRSKRWPAELLPH
jgi:hypothetical protein